MWKTGWVMEWENQVCYIAPVRARFNAVAKAILPMTRVLRKFEAAAQEAGKSLSKFADTYNRYN